MANEADVKKIIDDTDSVWTNPPARNGRFGNVLKAVRIAGVRGLEIDVEFTWPVTAIAGTNGSGKTTVLQICSSAYSGQGEPRRYPLGSWIRGALVGESAPVALPATLTYAFWDATPSFSVEYQPNRTRWNYPRRNNPSRNVEFIGITTFAPRIERRDRLHQARSRLEIFETEDVDTRITSSVSKILGVPYADLKHHKVGVASRAWEDDVPHLFRGTTSYTEAHMGAGEQKVVRLVRRIEAIPERSLILLEEPELTLHPDAQSGLAWYLMSIARRKGHQIIVATHSEQTFETLPQQARTLVVRTNAGVEVLHAVPQLRAARELSQTVRANHLLLLVEDEAAKALLQEIFRACDGRVLKCSRIVPVGNDDDVRRLTQHFRAAGVRVLGVLDGDRQAAVDRGIVALPGGAAPESLLIADDNIARADESLLSGVRDALALASAIGLNHTGSDRDKRVINALGPELGLSKPDVVQRLTYAWLSAHRAEARELVLQIREALEADPSVANAAHATAQGAG